MSLIYLRDGKWWMSGSFRIVRFWPYTTVVLDRILEVEIQDRDGLYELRDHLVKQSNEDGIKAHVDNKIAFEVEDDDGRKFYLGWKDGRFSVGTDFRTDAWNLRGPNEILAGKALP